MITLIIKRIGLLLLSLAMHASSAMELSRTGYSAFSLLVDNDLETHSSQDQEIMAHSFVLQALLEFKQGNLLLFDGLIGDNQCHINAVHIVDLFRRYQSGTLDIVLDTLLCEDDNALVTKYLTLNLILSSVIKNNKGPLVDRMLANRLLKEVGLSKRHKVPLINFLQNREMLAGATRALSHINMAYVRDNLIPALSIDKPHLAQEIDKLAASNLAREVDNISLSVLPKFAGIELVLHYIVAEKIPLIIRVKSICSHGIHYKIFQKNEDNTLSLVTDALDSHEPAIVIEGVSSSNTEIKRFSSYAQCRENCMYNLFAKNKVKDNNHSCLLCVEHTDNCCADGVINHNLQFCALDCISLQRAISADFMCTVQSDLAELINNGEFPLLAKKSDKWLAQAKQYQTCQSNISVFYIEHMYASTLGKATTTTRLVDSSAQELMAQHKNK